VGFSSVPGDMLGQYHQTVYNLGTESVVMEITNNLSDCTVYIYIYIYSKAKKFNSTVTAVAMETRNLRVTVGPITKRRNRDTPAFSEHCSLEKLPVA
jgi:hypothetical protein